MSKEEEQELQGTPAGGAAKDEKPEGKDRTAAATTPVTPEGEGDAGGASVPSAAGAEPARQPEANSGTAEKTDAEKQGEDPDPSEGDSPEADTDAPARDMDSPTAEKDSGSPDTESPSAKTDSGSPGKDSDTTDPGSDDPGEGEADPEAEIDASNAEDAEDSENERRHHIPFLDYHALSMENLVGELQRLLRTEKVQAIRKHVDSIKREFDQKFQDFIEEKKEEFISRGGEAADFHYNSVTKRQFNELYAEYREKRNQYYKNLEENLKRNLENRLEIIEELKGLVSVEEDMNTTYKNFKELQERWKVAGPIPRTHYNDVWRTYHHHVEIFYDFLSLNRELRDLDFRHNLEEKEKLCQRAEALAGEPDIGKAFRELQLLHKIWKEEIGPVGKEHREAIWERFSAATKKIHQRRQAFFEQQEAQYQVNLEKKQEIISKIEAISKDLADRHRAIQKQIREAESLRDQFFKAGKVPRKENEPTWAAFKKAVRSFNRGKNAFYKNLKKDQQENLSKKRALLERALELKDSEDWDAVTPEMKRIQQEWKEVGHVPRKYSDKIWKQFKEACNHYFDRLHARKNSAYAAEKKNLDLKTEVLDELKAFQLSGDREADLAKIGEFISRWKAVGHVPRNKKHVSSKFYKILDALFRKLGIGKQEAEILKYGDKIAQLSDTDDQGAVEQERQFVRKKIDDVKGEIRQLENNLNFFSEPAEDNPLVRDVIQNLEGKKNALAEWKGKLKKLNILKHHLNQEEAEDASGEEESDPGASG